MSFWDGLKKGAGEETGKSLVQLVKYGVIAIGLMGLVWVGWQYVGGPFWRASQWSSQKAEKAQEAVRRAGGHIGDAAAATKDATIAAKNVAIDKAANAAEAAREKAPAVIERAQEKIGDIVDTAREKAPEVIGKAQEKASGALDKTLEGGAKLGSSVRDRFKEWREKRKDGEPKDDRQ